MPRRPRESSLETRDARQRLKARAEPYWRRIHPGVFLGFRRTARVAGAWIARCRVGAGYREARLGVADDFADAGTADVLSYGDAIAAALKAAEGLGNPERASRRAPYTVTACMRDYLERYEGEGGRAIGAARAAVEAHILPALGEQLVSDLTAADLRRWLRGVAEAPARARSGIGAPVRHRAATATGTPGQADEQRRRRRSTANRVRTYLFAALNLAFREGRVSMDAAWRKVRPFKGTDAARVRFLTVAEAQRLLNACAPSFRDLVHGALVTGCRYGELARLMCADFDPDAGTVHIRQSKGGKPRHVPLTAEGVALFTRLTAGRRGGDPLFAKGGREWRKSEQARPFREACRVATIEPALSFHGLRHTYAVTLAQAGTPLQVIAAALGHADTRLTERWYAHLLPSYVADTVRANLPAFTNERGNVRQLRPGSPSAAGVATGTGRGARRIRRR